MKTINERLKTTRIEAGLSQQELADRAGFSKASISKLENEPARGLGADKLFDLAKVLAVDPHWLLTGKGSKTPASSVESWDSGTPLADDEVEIDYYSDVQAAAGNGVFAEDYRTDKKLRLPKTTFAKTNVTPENAKAANITGESAFPTMLDGTTVVFDIADKTPGKRPDFYWINTPDGNRVKLASMKKNGAILLESVNPDKEEYPDEEITVSGLLSGEYAVIGRVFMWSYLNYKK